MKLFSILLISLNCFANISGSELKKPNSITFDLTFQAPLNNIYETLQDMIKVEIAKQNFLERRQENIWQCEFDQFGTTYCPSGLAPARPYTSYYQSSSYEREASVIDYQNGSAVASTGSVVDYVNKVAIPFFVNKVIKLEAIIGSGPSVSNVVPINSNWVTVFSNTINSLSISLRMNGDILEARIDKTSCDGGNCSSVSNVVPINSNWVMISPQTNTANSSSASLRMNGDILEVLLEMNQCTEDGCSPISSVLPVNSIWVPTDISESTLGAFIRIRALRGTYTCPLGTVLDGSRCKGTSLICPSSYLDNGSNCKKTVNYTLYSYTCPSGYTAANTGLTTCSKTDPNTTIDNSAILDDACNSAIPPTGNCSKSISYKYYEYLCEAKNSFIEPIKNLNSGLKSPCSKTDSNNTIDNSGTLDDACNSSTPPVNNCKSTEYTCNSNLFKPVYVGGEWVCSPFMCDGNMKCGYGTCDLPLKPSLDKYQDVAYNPLQYIANNQCNLDLCDYVINAKVSYCESAKCPKGDDIIEESGKCYKLECPAGTYLSGDKCIKVN